MLVMVSKACPVGFEASMWSIFFSLNDVAGTVSGVLVSYYFISIMSISISTI